MNDDDFEWNDDKAVKNAAKHRGVTFDDAKKVFRDPFGIELLDDRENYGEERLVLIGMSNNRLLTVVYTERGGKIRIISAREAEKYEHDDYYRQNAIE